ncbi:arginine/serine-rich coiled-coil protein 2 isoform X2 [Cinnamomum micranthum f. kanehirae]|uniref:Arginine/serine-rich coiled-coil protein 2 isoform X2 n=1 Tax=Cinnamomum micranthum f. kanehirae TaxID=337451 RepID=A0A3S3PWG6_9MAGN|nr:arginine/serine-rich coiled-coil protein 2 isoform X2 [Cinnamomum micranthum f. kanehirae]
MGLLGLDGLFSPASVNRNIVGSGYMSTDQKKKLLWGNKKTTAAVEGVEGDLKLEQKPTDKDGSSLFLAEKQEQLQQDLEKQYTAGLRRRDGRTVGLGL